MVFTLPLGLLERKRTTRFKGYPQLRAELSSALLDLRLEFETTHKRISLLKQGDFTPKRL